MYAFLFSKPNAYILKCFFTSSYNLAQTSIQYRALSITNDSMGDIMVKMAVAHFKISGNYTLWS